MQLQRPPQKKKKAARALALMLVALFWYIWGQVCLYIKNEHNID